MWREQSYSAFLTAVLMHRAFEINDLSTDGRRKRLHFVLFANTLCTRAEDPTETFFIAAILIGGRQINVQLGWARIIVAAGQTENCMMTSFFKEL